tara:strand:+ start:38 stop:247 length:210 start_codon:yes stop_codon:yes gene_type:complete
VLCEVYIGYGILSFFVERGNAVDTPDVFYEDIASGLMQNRGAPFWGFSLEERKWAEAHFLLGDLNGCVR